MRVRSEAFVLVFAAACGGSSPTSAGGGNNPPPGAPTVSVAMSEDRFRPDTVRVTVGTVVRWSNEGTVDHRSTSDSTNGWDSGAVAPPQPQMTCPYPPCDKTPGGSFPSTFTAAGTYPYHCAFHVALGMRGVVIVTP